MRSNPINNKKIDMANPASTSARCSPKGWRIDARFQTSKLCDISTITQRRAEEASKKIRWDRAVRAADDSPL